MFERAVICTDLSPQSDALIELVPLLRELGLREVVLAHVVDIFGDMPPAGRDSLDDAFERQAGKLEAYGLRVHVDIPVGQVSDSVQEAAARSGADLIIAGGRGQGLYDGAHSGSVASDVVRAATVPVLLGLDSVLAGAGVLSRRLTERILHPTDFSEAASRAFGYVEQLVSGGARRVLLLHIQDSARLSNEGPARLREYDSTDTQRLARMRVRLLDLGAEDVELEVVHGHPGPEVATRAGSGEYSLMVMGSRGRTRDADRLLGSVSDASVRGAACPVLLAPASSAEGD